MEPRKRIAPHFQTSAGQFWILSPRAPVPPGGQDIPDWDFGYREILLELFGGSHYQANAALTLLEGLGVATHGLSQDKLLAEHLLKQRSLFRFAKLQPVGGHGAVPPSAPKPPPPPEPQLAGEFREFSIADRLAGWLGLAGATPGVLTDFEIQVEVAGTGLESGQSLYLYSDGDSPAADQLPKTQGKDSHRSLAVFSDLPERPRKLALAITMPGSSSPLLLPLSEQARPLPKGAKRDEWDQVLIPVRPFRTLISGVAEGQSSLLTRGWLYVFWQGRLWRELAVDDQSTLRDVRVDWYRGQYKFGIADTSAERKAEGRLLQTVWVPYKVDGALQTEAAGVRLAFSSAQWGWERIQSLEADAAKLERQSISLDALQSYSKQQSFQANSVIGPIANALSDAPTDLQRSVEPQRQQRIAAAYLPGGEQLRIKILDANGQPLSGAQYKLEVSGIQQSGSTDGEGCIDLQAVSASEVLRLTLWPTAGVVSDRRRWRLRIGDLAPLSDEKGKQQRLLYLSGIPANLQDPPLAASVKQRFMKALQMTGEEDLEAYLEHMEKSLA